MVEYVLVHLGHGINAAMWKVQSIFGGVDQMILIWGAVVIFGIFLIFGTGRKPGT
jgi:hypothetical protein